MAPWPCLEMLPCGGLEVGPEHELDPPWVVALVDDPAEVGATRERRIIHKPVRAVDQVKGLSPELDRLALFNREKLPHADIQGDGTGSGEHSSLKHAGDTCDGSLQEGSLWSVYV